MASKVPPPKVLQRFGRLRVVIPEGRKRGRLAVLCICDCGRLAAPHKDKLLRGAINSCGCGRKKHGMARSKTYSSWAEMLRRTRGGHEQDFAHYEGISVCPQWDPQQGGSFEQFLADMGERPKGKTLDRYPDREGDYCPENCRWATPAEQAENRRNTILLTYKSETLTLASWARRLGIGYSTMRHRYKAGWTVEQIVELKPYTQNRVN